MFDWLKLLFSKPPPHTPLTAYTSWNGVFYMLAGAIWYVWPGSVQVVLRAPAFQSVGEVGLVRAIGLLLAILGYFYFFGARTGQDRFGVATILDRLLVPFLLVPLVIVGELSPQAGLPFAFIDPVLAIGAWIVHSRSLARPAEGGRAEPDLRSQARP
jgi:hypothetical protein